MTCLPHSSWIVQCYVRHVGQILVRQKQHWPSDSANAQHHSYGVFLSSLTTQLCQNYTLWKIKSPKPAVTQPGKQWWLSIQQKPPGEMKSSPSGISVGKSHPLAPLGSPVSCLFTCQCLTDCLLAVIGCTPENSKPRSTFPARLGAGGLCTPSDNSVFNRPQAHHNSVLIFFRTCPLDQIRHNPGHSTQLREVFAFSSEILFEVTKTLGPEVKKVFSCWKEPLKCHFSLTRERDTPEKSVLSRNLHEHGHSQVWMGLLSPISNDTSLKGYQSKTAHKAAGIAEPFRPTCRLGRRYFQGFVQPNCSEASWLLPQALAESHTSEDILGQGFWKVAHVVLWLPPLPLPLVNGPWWDLSKSA